MFSIRGQNDFSFDSQEWAIRAGSDKVIAAVAIGLVKFCLVLSFKNVSGGPMDPAIALVYSIWQYAYVRKPDININHYRVSQGRILNFTVSLNSLWIYFFASLLGSIFAGLLFLHTTKILEDRKRQRRKQWRALVKAQLKPKNDEQNFGASGQIDLPDSRMATQVNAGEESSQTPNPGNDSIDFSSSSEEEDLDRLATI